MKRIKEAILIILAFFVIGGVIGVMYGIFTGAYYYCEGIMLVKNILIMFLTSAICFIIFWAVVAVIVFLLKVLAKLFK